MLPGITDYSGDWTLTLTKASDNCPAELQRLSPFREVSMLTIAQLGTRLTICTDRLYTSTDGLMFEGSSIEEVAGQDFDTLWRLSGGLPSTMDGIAVTAEFDLVPSGLPPAPGCVQTWSGSLSRWPACTSSAACVRDVHPCGRCIAGFCARPPSCR